MESFGQTHGDLPGLLRRGIALHESEDLASAAAVYRLVLETVPDHPSALYLLGVAEHGRGRFQKAAGLLCRAGTLSPDNPYPFFYLGLAREAAGDISGAMAAYRRSLSIDGDLAEAATNLANLFSAAGRKKEALDLYRRACSAAPENADVHLNLAKALYEGGMIGQAEASFCEVIRLRPGSVDAIDGLGRIRFDQGDFSEAAAFFRRALALDPEAAKTVNRLGCAHLSAGNPEEAAAAFKKAAAFDPSLAEVFNNLGKAFRDLGRIERSVRCYDRAVAMEPDNPAFRFNRAVALLLKGDFKRGWQDYEFRLHPGAESRAQAFLAPDIPIWDGSPLAGRHLLVSAEQGFGDTIQFARYLRKIDRNGGRVTLHCPSALHRLFAGISDIDALTDSAAAAPKADVQVPIMSLARIFNTRLKTIPSEVPYLGPGPRHLQKRSAVESFGGPKIGLVWSGNPGHRNDANRSIALSTLATVVDACPVPLYSLQKGPAARQIDASAMNERLIDVGSTFSDFADTAAVLSRLDLLITVDTAAAHLAGALAVPVWILLPFAPDWRWLTGRSDSPWYPTMRVFRQPAPGRWEPVIDQVASRIRRLSASVGP